MLPRIDGPAPAVYTDEIPAVDGFIVDPAVPFRLIDMKLVEAHDAYFIELRNRDRRMGGTAASGGENTFDLQNNPDIVRNRIGTDQNEGCFRFLLPEMLDPFFGIDRPACQCPTAHPDPHAEKRPFKITVTDKSSHHPRFPLNHIAGLEYIEALLGGILKGKFDFLMAESFIVDQVIPLS